MIVKICGLRTKRELVSAIKAGADELGFVVGVPESRRNVPLEKARELLGIGARQPIIAVTVAKSAAGIEELVSGIEPKHLQIHGKVPAAEWKGIARICRARGVEVIRAVRADAGAHKEIRCCGTGTILLDSATVGGTGKKADWKRCARIAKRFRSKKIKLSGGLTPENVHEAIMQVRPWAVDVSSGVEEKGRKSAKRMKAFIRAAKLPG